MTFRRCGYVGVVAAATVALLLAAHLGLSLWREAGLIVTACITFLGLAAITRRIAGRERLVYYHHEVVVLAVVAVVAWLAGGQVLAHLDATALGLGMFLAFGRIGCLVAGCCHGRPAPRGIVYGNEHTEHGFPRHLVGVRLIPVQAIESALVVVIVGCGCALVLGGWPGGTGFALYVSAYALGRFGLEFLRGDPLRPYWRGLSEAQWTSLLLAPAVALAGVLAVLPENWWDLALATVTVLAGVGTLLAARRAPDLLAPRHLQELSRSLGRLRAAKEGARAIELTSAGVSLSCGYAGGRELITFSGADGALSDAEAKALARVLAALRTDSDPELVAGVDDVWHVLL